jgi:hypothetical protein
VNESPTKVVLYNRTQWIKATYNNRTKRINNPPKNLQELHEIIRLRFKDLDDKLKKDNSLGIAIEYIDDEGERILVDDSRELIEAYKYAEIASENKNILKFMIDTCPKSNLYLDSPQKI